MKALFDTNILIDYLVGREDAHAELARHSTRLVSVVTWMEVLVGAHDDAEEDVIDMFLREFTMVPISRAIAREAIALRRSHRLRLPDAIIWATARTESALLVTRDARAFAKDEPGIRIPY